MAVSVVQYADSSMLMLKGNTGSGDASSKSSSLLHSSIPSNTLVLHGQTLVGCNVQDCALQFKGSKAAICHPLIEIAFQQSLEVKFAGLKLCLHYRLGPGLDSDVNGVCLGFDFSGVYGFYLYLAQAWPCCHNNMRPR